MEQWAMNLRWDYSGHLRIICNMMDLAALPGFVALYESEKVGLVTYNIAGASCEIVTIDSIRPSSGVGSALIEAVKPRIRFADHAQGGLSNGQDAP